jgi:hypothetical protein
MYYPKYQVKTNLYTNGGDFILLNNSTQYKGYYYETSDGRYFSGKTPNESPSFEIVKVNQNEPTTNLSPSLHDNEITSRIVELGKLIEINVLDHLIITNNGYFSYADKNLL